MRDLERTFGTSWGWIVDETEVGCCVPKLVQVHKGKPITGVIKRTEEA
jgi:hypothetical protein